MRLLVQIIWLVLYLYYIEKISELEKGRGKRIVSGGIALGMVLLTQIPAVFGASEQAVFWSRTGGWYFFCMFFFMMKSLSESSGGRFWCRAVWLQSAGRRRRGPVCFGTEWF